MIPKVVIDTNIYISAIFWGGKPRKVMDLGRDEKILIFTSSDIEGEIVEKLRKKFRLAKEETNQIISDQIFPLLPSLLKSRTEFRPCWMILMMTSLSNVPFPARLILLCQVTNIYYA